MNSHQTSNLLGLGFGKRTEDDNSGLDGDRSNNAKANRGLL